jgi:hypothetical protein
LWGGIRGGRKISWVSWKEVCKPRSQGGLGVRDIGKVNLSLLIKWRWRLLHHSHAFWKDILLARYGTEARFNVHWCGASLPIHASLWWKDMCRIDITENGSWFAQNIRRKMGNGMTTRFWRDVWIWDSPLCDRFPRLFSISLLKEGIW